MRIIKFEPKYRDDMIFMVLEAKNALGRIPRINEDLLDIQKSYFDHGDMFWIAVKDGRVIGCVGYNTMNNTNEICLHRLYIKPTLKHQGIGTALLKTVEEYAKSRGVSAIYVHLGTPPEQWFESYEFYPKNGFYVYDPLKPNMMKKYL